MKEEGWREGNIKNQSVKCKMTLWDYFSGAVKTGGKSWEMAFLVVQNGTEWYKSVQFWYKMVQDWYGLGTKR